MFVTLYNKVKFCIKLKQVYKLPSHGSLRKYNHQFSKIWIWLQKMSILQIRKHIAYIGIRKCISNMYIYKHVKHFVQKDKKNKYI